MTAVLLCDADGCLFPSEEPAFAASTEVTNGLLAELGIDRRFDAEELKGYAVGKNFRATALELAAEHGRTLAGEDLERWVEEERRAVIEHLRGELRPDPRVAAPLERLSARYRLTVVSSSALARLDACFEVTGLEALFPPDVRFSAEDSLPVPTSKPDPAIYAFAGERLGVGAHDAVAIEDSATGARSALAAGFPTIGNVMFVPAQEREQRVTVLRELGVAAIVESWDELGPVLEAGVAPALR